MNDNPIGAIGDIAIDLHGISQLIAALHLSVEKMGDQDRAMRLLEWLVAEKADELDGLAEQLRAERLQPVLPVARCVPRAEERC